MSDLPAFDIRPVGDSALIVQLGQPGACDRLVDDVLRVERALQQAQIPGLVEITTAFRTVALFYDPVRVPGDPASIFTVLETLIRAALSEPSSGEDVSGAAERTIDVPVCYDPEFALDLGDVARHSALPSQEIVRLHASAEYRVGCVGFTPGFPYLIGLPDELATPRRANPRTAVPAGSVGIGGSQTGIYPMPSPGGWNVIGRTPLRLFDAARETPSLLRAGDRVRFREISRAEFRDWRRRALAPEPRR